MTTSWELRTAERLVGTLVREGIDMFWDECLFTPGEGWREVEPLFAASRYAWRARDTQAALAADEVIRTSGLVLVPIDGGEAITEFVVRIWAGTARLKILAR